MTPNVLTALASAVRTATTTWDPILDGKLGGVQNSLFANPETNLDFSALVAMLNLTAAPGIDTVLLKMQEQDPVSLAWFDIPGAATLAQVAAAMIKLFVGPAIATVAAGVSVAALNIPLPARWRLQIVHSAGTNFTYSLALNLYQAL